MSPKRKPVWTDEQRELLLFLRAKIDEEHNKVYEQDVRILSFMLILKARGLVTAALLRHVFPQADRQLAAMAAQLAVDADDVLGKDTGL
jgi:hypothetical protein